MDERARYVQERDCAGMFGNTRFFSEVIGRHASRLVDMARHSDKRALVSTCNELHKINDEWVSLLSAGALHDSEYRRVCARLVHGYSECIGDYILEGACHLKRVEDLTHAEGTFYAHLGQPMSHPITRRHWRAYSAALTDFADTVRLHGIDSDSTWAAATQTLVAGRLLGSWLDIAIK